MPLNLFLDLIDLKFSPHHFQMFPPSTSSICHLFFRFSLPDLIRSSSFETLYIAKTETFHTKIEISLFQMRNKFFSLVSDPDNMEFEEG